MFGFVYVYIAIPETKVIPFVNYDYGNKLTLHTSRV